jgi:2'-5' RNA ligase
MTGIAARGRGAPESADPSVPRLFIAVPLAEDARAAVEALVEEARRDVEARARQPRSEVRWVRLDGLHLTLRFLGPTPEARVTKISEVVDQVAADARPFLVTIRGGGAFPSPSRPRTLWLGIASGEGDLAALTADVGHRLREDGWPVEDRPYRAHLTVARSDGRREGPLVARTLIGMAATFETSFEADRVVLFESVTGGGPARYVARHEAKIRR